MLLPCSLNPMLSRRELLRIGSLSTLGLTLPALLRAEAESRGVRSCILLFLEGGPSHIDLWDMKPKAPAEVRGEFRPIASSFPGEPICEHLPLLAKQWHQFALIRSVHHGIVDHNAGAYYSLTGRSPVSGGKLIIRDEPDNFPPFGSVLASLYPLTDLPEFVHLPDIMSNNGHDLPGQRAGFLGASCDPLVVGDVSDPKYQPGGLSLPREISRERLHLRRSLLGHFEPQSEESWDGMPLHYRKAFSLLESTTTRQALEVQKEPESVRLRYGLPDRVDRSVEARKFGGLPHLGMSLLAARRLIEAGVRLVTVASGRRIDQAWDTHRDHFPLLKRSLLPYLDRALAALLEDLDERGMLEETLVVVMGEFGRTPRLGQITSGAGADAAGRDHWPHCYTVLLAGAGIQSGIVHGASDRIGAYPDRNPVTPEDVAATIYTALGLDPHMRILDPQGRPQELALGEPIAEVLRSSPQQRKPS